MSVNKWLSKLDDDFNKLASSIDDVTKNVIKLPSPSLNFALDNGGLVEGKSICLYGPESSGKSLVGMITLIEIQKKYPDGICILFDTEYAFTKEWFVKLGGDPDRLVVRQTNDPTKIFDYMYGELYELLQEGMPLKAVMIDSVKNIAFPKDIKDSSTNMVQGGSGAAYLGPVLKRIMPVIREFNVTAILIQQIYEEMDQYKKLRNPYIVPDGRALKHFCDYMVQIDKIDKKDSIVESGKTLIGTEQQIGHKVRLKVKKNRVGKPYRIAEFTLLYASGIANVANELYDLAKSLSIIYHPVNEEGRANPQMWQFGNYDPIRGEDNMRQFVVGDVKVQQEMMLACESASEDAIKARSQAIGGDDVDVDPESL